MRTWQKMGYRKLLAEVEEKSLTNKEIEYYLNREDEWEVGNLVN